MQYEELCERIAKDKEFKGQYFKVWHCLLDELDIEEFAVLETTKLAQYLKTYRANIHRALNFLLARGLLERGPKYMGLHTYRLAFEYRKDDVRKLPKYKPATVHKIDRCVND